MANELGPCLFKFGERAPVCGEPGITIITMTLPQWVADGVMIAEDQRKQTFAVCGPHKDLIDSLMAPGVFNVANAPAVVRTNVPIGEEHRAHQTYVPGCHGCALDFEPPWASRGSGEP